MSAEKIEAIYELREAAEDLGRVDAQTAARNDADAREMRLAAREKLEEKTVHAIEACHDCEHSDGRHPPPRQGGRADKSRV